MNTLICENGCWIVAHNNVDTFHVLEVTAGATVKTGQPYIEMFPTEEEAWLSIPEEFRPVEEEEEPLGDESEPE